jgi:hypothetical protein
MCFRLYAAVRPTGQALDSVAFRHGLDVRTAERGATGYLEVAWGDCACSLYTKKEGRERAVGFIEDVLDSGVEVQLLFFSDGETPDPSGDPVPVSRATFHAQGLQALPSGRVAQIR